MPHSTKSGLSRLSASIISTTSCGSRVGSTSARPWFSAPAFLAVLPTVSTTSAPRARAIATVPSVQLSAATRIRSGGWVCRRRLSIVSAMLSSSSCAGTSAMTRDARGRVPAKDSPATSGGARTAVFAANW
jgi:hypothetical protein